MRIEPTADRRPRAPLWAVAIVAVWLALVGAAALLNHATGGGGPALCWFKAVTGRPCPTCGSTRLFLAAGHGRLVEAFRLNPLVFVATIVAGGWLVLRVAFKRRVVLITSARSRWMATALLILAVLANWVYLLIDKR